MHIFCFIFSYLSQSLFFPSQLPVKFSLSLFKLPPMQPPQTDFNDSFNYLPFTMTETCSCYVQAGIKHSPKRYGASP